MVSQSRGCKNLSLDTFKMGSVIAIYNGYWLERRPIFMLAAKRLESSLVPAYKVMLAIFVSLRLYQNFLPR